MITSLLSLYITSSISLNLGTTVSDLPSPAKSIISAASYDLSEISEAKVIPVKNPYYISPIINAKSSIGIDLNTGTVLYEENAHERLSIASITKLMTVLIALEENDPNEVVTISKNSAATEGSTMYLREGEEIYLKNLIYGAMINSANDAAVAIAEHNAGTVEDFVEKMNKKTIDLGLINTHFSNPIGLDHPDNYSSANDVSKLARYVYQKQFIRASAATKEMEVTSINGEYTHNLESTNTLLDSYLHIKGLKTGRTDRAGLCLVTVAENDSGNEIITVVLNSPARFTETKILVDWLFRAYSW